MVLHLLVHLCLVGIFHNQKTATTVDERDFVRVLCLVSEISGHRLVVGGLKPAGGEQKVLNEEEGV